MGRSTLLYNSMEEVKNEIYQLLEQCEDFLERNKDRDELFVGMIIVATRQKYLRSALQVIKYARKKNFDKAQKNLEATKKHYLTHKYQLKKLNMTKKEKDYYKGLYAGLKMFVKLQTF